MPDAIKLEGPSALRAEGNTLHRALPSGRSLVVRVGQGSEEIQILSPKGDVEVSVHVGAEGPVVSVRAVRLEVETPRLAVKCEEIDLEATRGVRLSAGENIEVAGEKMLRVRTQDEIRANGSMIRLNCDEPD